MPRISKASIIAQAARDALPVATYLRIMHEAALTGFAPVLNTDGSATGTFTALKSEERMKILTYLIDKIVPNAVPKQLEHTVAEPVDVLERPNDLSTLPIEQLRALVVAAKDAQFTASTPAPVGQDEDDV